MDNVLPIETETENATKLAIVYVLTNQSMPGLIKIGRTQDLQARVLSLSSATGVPQPFEIAYAAFVENAPFVERAMHAAFAMHRMPNREFFRMPVTPAIAVLSLAEVEQVQLADDDRQSDIIQEVRQRGTMRGRKADPRIVSFVEQYAKANGRHPSGSEIKSHFPELPTSTAYDYSRRTA